MFSITPVLFQSNETLSFDPCQTINRVMRLAKLELKTDLGVLLDDHDGAHFETKVGCNGAYYALGSMERHDLKSKDCFRLASIVDNLSIGHLIVLSRSAQEDEITFSFIFAHECEHARQESTFSRLNLIHDARLLVLYWRQLYSEFLDLSPSEIGADVSAYSIASQLWSGRDVNGFFDHEVKSSRKTTQRRDRVYEIIRSGNSYDFIHEYIAQIKERSHLLSDMDQQFFNTMLEKYRESIQS